MAAVFGFKHLFISIQTDGEEAADRGMIIRLITGTEKESIFREQEILLKTAMWHTAGVTV